MFIAFKLFNLELIRHDCWKDFLQYRKALRKAESHSLRINFLENCLKADIIPRFLTFRIPNNGCFNDKAVHEFQVRLLKREIFTGKEEKKLSLEKLTENREKLKVKLPEKCIPSVILHCRYNLRLLRQQKSLKLNDKLLRLSKKQEKPLFNVNNTVLFYNLETVPPKFVLDTLSLGPRNAIIDRFDQNDVLSELDDFLKYCKDKNIDEETITDINIKTLSYIKDCRKQKTPRNVQLTRKYLAENRLLAVPFDKGIGICIMKNDSYNEKLSVILNLPQFRKVLSKRKNEKNPVLKEEERILSLLKRLKKDNKIDDSLFKKLKPIGSQPPRLYGLAKVHKTDIPLRPVLSMPGSPYFKIAVQVSEWLSIVDECKINSSTKTISNSLRNINLLDNRVLISFDVTSLYTNVPVDEAINECTNLLFSGKYKQPPVDKETFRTLLTVCSQNVLMLTNDGYYQQIDGLAMGSPPAPMLANGWLSKFDSTIRGDSDLFSRYMDDVVRDIDKNDIEKVLHNINNLHPSLHFTTEIEKEGSLPFLDMKIIRANGQLISTWYTKPTDTGLTMNYHSLAPEKYKRSVVSGMIHRIIRACSTWIKVHESIMKAKKILLDNQYPPSFFDPIIKKTLHSIFENKEATAQDEAEKKDDEEEERKMLFIQYRGKVSEKYEKSLKRIGAPCKVIFTIRKLKTSLPTLKSEVPKALKSGVVYHIICSRCKSCYVGQTTRHLQTRIKEHSRQSSLLGVHFKECNSILSIDDVNILSRAKSAHQLLVLEALYINQLKPLLNTKDEYRSHTLVIKI